MYTYIARNIYVDIDEDIHDLLLGDSHYGIIWASLEHFPDSAMDW